MTNAQLKLRPLSDHVIVEPQVNVGNTAGEILLFGRMKKKHQSGVVVASGPGRIDDAGKRIEMDLKTGDMVLFAHYSGTEIKYGSRKLLIVRESEILATIEN